MGRPTKYQEAYAEQARKLCLLGYTDAELADFFEVSESTINKWKIDYPGFSESIKKGKQVADGNVAERLYLRAMGYVAPDVDIRVINDQIVETPLEKHYPPDTTAAIFWLKNRQGRNWRDKQEIDLSSSDGSMTPTGLNDFYADIGKAKSESSTQAILDDTSEE
ncbi:helix-turn-helix domain-containing protein [Photorhabdus sp. RM71S]|uniref:helix-turn-helix domain-containing protein n=1 Tax=Photorhabdus sp. RM71S TaxID=3342824 RepID=UPI0036DE9D12